MMLGYLRSGTDDPTHALHKKSTHHRHHQVAHRRHPLRQRQDRRLQIDRQPRLDAATCAAATRIQDTAAPY